MKKNIFKIIIVFIISAILFSNIIVDYRSFDTYRIETRQGINDYAFSNSFNDGRIFMGIICLIADIANIPTQALATFDSIAALLIMSFCVVYLSNTLKKLTDKYNYEFLFLILSFLFYFNFMMVDIMQFLEDVVIAASILLYTIAAKKLVIDKKTGLSLVLVIVGMFSYQATICCFLQLVLMWVLMTNKQSKDIIKSIAISLVAIGINYTYILIYEHFSGNKLLRLNGELLLNITKIFANIKDLIISSSLFFYDYLWLAFILTIMLVIMIFCLKKNQHYYRILELFIITIYSIAIPISMMVVAEVRYLYMRKGVLFCRLFNSDFINLYFCSI